MEVKVKSALVLIVCSDGSVREALLSAEQRAKIDAVLMEVEPLRIADIDLSEVLKIDESKC